MYDALTVGLIFLAIIVVSFIATWMGVLKRPRDAGFHASLNDAKASYEDEIHGDVVIVPQAAGERGK